MSFFWNGYVLRDFIFKNFNTKTYSGFIGVFVALLSLGILYEGMYLLKKELLEKFLAIRRQTRINADNQRIESGNSDSEDVNINPRNSLINDERFNELNENLRISEVSSRWSQSQEFSYLFMSSALHGCYVFLGYGLMNAVMTFNIWILIAVCLGIGLGYLFFRTDDKSLNGDSADLHRNTSIEAFAQLHDENDKTDENDDDHGAAAGTSLVRRDRDSTTAKKSPPGSERARSPFKAGNRQDGAVEAPAGQVIVVGAQVHCDYQQSV